MMKIVYLLISSMFLFNNIFLKVVCYFSKVKSGKLNNSTSSPQLIYVQNHLGLVFEFNFPLILLLRLRNKFFNLVKLTFLLP